MSYITDEELAWLEKQPAWITAPLAITDHHSSFFILAKHTGSCKISGELYTYLKDTDELIRDDILKLVNRRRREAKKAKIKEEDERTGRLF